jgi:hypothetical protein
MWVTSFPASVTPATASLEHSNARIIHSERGAGMTMPPFMPRPDEPDDNTEEEQVLETEPMISSELTALSPPTGEQLPAEAQSQTNGGPLGCCLGVTVGLLLSLSIVILSRLYATPLAGALHGWLAFTVRAVLIVVGIIAAIVFGYLGWRIGARVYREYELSPQQKERLKRLEKRQRQHCT